jgi:diguanylate cyclase (GGDEF)-like protein
MEDLILIVDDARFARRIETKALQDAGFEHIVEAKTAKEALQIFEEQAPELTLLDITLPDNSDLTLLRTMIKIRPEAKIVMNSAIGQELIIQDALNADAFLRCKIDLETEMVVEVDGKILKEQIPYQQYLKENILSVTGKEDWKNVICQSSKEYLIDEYQKGQDVIEIQFQMQYQGTERWVSCMIYLMTDNCRNGHIQALMILNDIDKRKREELRLKERAERDGLTGLYNATTMKMKADNFLQSLWALEGNHIFMLMDLDCFKQINDTFGHQYGDQVLKDVSQTLTKTFRHNDLIGRMGGDEFAIMILNVSDFSVIEHTVQQLLKELHKSYEQNGKTVEVSASLGIVTAPEHGTTFEELYQKSDQMLYEVKRSVKNGYRLYQEKESEHETDFNCR